MTTPGRVRALLNLFYRGERGVIRSRSRLVVKNGEIPDIDVGNEIPIITRISDSDQQAGGTTNILQEESPTARPECAAGVKSVVHADGQVDICGGMRGIIAPALFGEPRLGTRRVVGELLEDVEQRGGFAVRVAGTPPAQDIPSCFQG